LKDLSQSEDTITKINQIEGIAKIRSRKDITENLLSLQRIITVFAGTFFVIFFSISVFIISNTVRLAVFARRREINIMKYVGRPTGLSGGPSSSKASLSALSRACRLFRPLGDL
jgi:cell division transport system permease protein